MGHKRNSSEQVAKSFKRRKRISNCVENGQTNQCKSSRNSEEISDGSSEISAEYCGSETFSPDSKSDVNESISDCDSLPEMTKYLAIDCEMVGVGHQRSSALARCSVVNYNGEVIFDTFVRPEKPVTDYRTKWSGVRESDLKEALSFKKAREEVKTIIKNSVLIGHSIQSDLHALYLSHPLHLLRDTAQYHPIRSLAGLSINNTPSLKYLSSILLNETIQDNEHCSVEDARAALALYKLCEQQWEKELRGELTTQSYFSDLYWPAWTRTESSI